MSATRAMAQLFPQAALWLTMGILAFGWIQAVLSFGNEIQLLATCLEIQVAEGHWTEMKKLPTASEIHVKFGVRRSSSSILSFYVLYIIYNYLYIYIYVHIIYHICLCPVYVLSISFLCSSMSFLCPSLFQSPHKSCLMVLVFVVMTIATHCKYL